MKEIGKFTSPTQAIKVASLLVHVQEGWSNKGHVFDLDVIGTLIEDPEVVAWLNSFDPVFLPQKR